MSFFLVEFIRQRGFIQTRDSDKRDIFEQDYSHPFLNTIYKACVTIAYDSGYSSFNAYSIPLLTIELLLDKESIVLFNGISPFTYEQAIDLFNLTLPSPDFLIKVGEYEAID